MTWRMIRSWISHGLVTATFGLLGFIAGGASWAIACAVGFYFGREVRQHERDGTFGIEWLDRIMDAAVPILVALGFALWM